jgi:hypothetical protein
MAKSGVACTGHLFKRHSTQMKNASIDAATISAIILQEDPIALYSDEDSNTDEYDSEAECIAKALPSCRTYDECLDMIWDVFKEMFGPREAESLERYTKLAHAIWKLRTADSRRNLTATSHRAVVPRPVPNRRGTSSTDAACWDSGHILGTLANSEPRFPSPTTRGG